VDGITEWERETEVPGGDRELDPAPNFLYWRMNGLDGSGNRSTGYSNIVQMDNG
jgi:hypothetical protein